jgi:hypothetical protein
MCIKARLPVPKAEPPAACPTLPARSGHPPSHAASQTSSQARSQRTQAVAGAGSARARTHVLVLVLLGVLQEGGQLLLALAQPHELHVGGHHRLQRGPAAHAQGGGRGRGGGHAGTCEQAPGQERQGMGCVESRLQVWLGWWQLLMSSGCCIRGHPATHFSSPTTSCSTSSTSRLSGTGSWRLASRRSSVDLPRLGAGQVEGRVWEQANSTQQHQRWLCRCWLVMPQRAAAHGQPQSITPSPAPPPTPLTRWAPPGRSACPR